MYECYYLVNIIHAAQRNVRGYESNSSRLMKEVIKALFASDVDVDVTPYFQKLESLPKYAFSFQWIAYYFKRGGCIFNCLVDEYKDRKEDSLSHGHDGVVEGLRFVLISLSNKKKQVYGEH